MLSIGTKLKGNYGTKASSATKKNLIPGNAHTKFLEWYLISQAVTLVGKSCTCFFPHKTLHIYLLRPPCCHHLCEIILSHVWDSLKI